MGLDGTGTLAGVIRDHSVAEIESERILLRHHSVVEGMARQYEIIRSVMSKPGVRGSAVMDRATGLVYVPMPNGLIAHFNVIDSEDVPAAIDGATDDDHASHITLGETS